MTGDSRAKLFQKIADNVAINIQDYDHIVGRIGPTIVGNYTEIDIEGDYLDGLWSEDGIQATLHDKTTLSHEDWRSCARQCGTFRGQNPVDCVNRCLPTSLATAA